MIHPPHDDPRGSLCELLTTREGPIEPIVHVSHFVNMPANVYRPETPDKCRLDVDDPRIPYAFR
jgi:hypothetical protein